MDNKILTVDGQFLVYKNSLISVPNNVDGPASQVIYDNTTSGLAADNVQAAIDELVVKNTSIQSDIEEVASKIPSVEGLATEEYVNTALGEVSSQIPSTEGLATEEFVNNSVGEVASQIPSIEGLASEEYVETAIEESTPSVITAIIPTNWTGNSAPYTQEFIIEGITEDDIIMVDVVLSDDFETSQLEEAEWGKVHKIEKAENSLIIYMKEPTTVELTIQITILNAKVSIGDPVLPEVPEGPVFPEIGKTLDEYTWEEISMISAAGEGPNYFNVGDCKAVEVKGTVGTLDVDATYYVYIIGFDHNGATNTIDFGTFKTAATNGVDVCLIDSKYNNNSTDGTKYFNMNHSSDTNSGGWKGCDLRYSVLGSTDSDGADASVTTATSPVPGSLMAALPSDLRAVMKPMTIYTDNAGGGTDTASNVTSSIDYLPILAEFEIFGSKQYANSAEQNYQKLYDYYAASNSKIKYNHNSVTSAVNYWLRSPYTGASTNFCRVYVSYGNAVIGTNNSKFSDGIHPIFRV